MSAQLNSAFLCQSLSSGAEISSCGSLPGAGALLCLQANLNSHLFGLLQNQKDPGVLDRMMKKLDLNSDGQLDFQEFLNLIGGIAVACHDSLVVKAPVH